MALAAEALQRSCGSLTRILIAGTNIVQTKITKLHSNTVAEISAFLDETLDHQQLNRIPAGVVLAGPYAGLRSTLTQLQQRFKAVDARRTLVSLSSSSGANLKALLKALIQKATTRQETSDDDDELSGARSGNRCGPRLLNYDLQGLHDHVQERQIQQVVVILEDTEAIEGHLLSEFVETLGYWSDRIPFVCLMSIATSVEFLQQRLSKAAVKCLDGRLFEALPSSEEVEHAFKVMTESDVPIWIGSNLAGLSHERQTDYVQSVDEFTDAVNYAYMSTYYANALSIFLVPGLSSKDVSSDHYEAVRNLDSFREFARRLLANNETQRLNDVLTSDPILFGVVRNLITQGRNRLTDLTLAVDTLRTVQRCLPNTQISTYSTLYLQAMNGKLNGSALVRSLLLTLRKSPSHAAVEILQSILIFDLPHDVGTACKSLAKELSMLLKAQGGSTTQLRSEDDVKNSTLRTTVVAQKVELSKQKSSLSKQDAAYTAIVRRLSDVLEGYFTDQLIDPESLVFHEIFVYDLKSPYREVFTPRPRHAIERALAAPHDYLDCDCCAPEQGDGDEATLASSQPATAVLYQLYLESGNLINVSDLWQAFQAVLGDQHSEEQTMALFQRALAELRYLGLVKSTRKRVDHIAKAAWRGL